jgi:hypothetical protein
MFFKLLNEGAIAPMKLKVEKIIEKFAKKSDEYPRKNPFALQYAPAPSVCYGCFKCFTW